MDVVSNALRLQQDYGKMPARVLIVDDHPLMLEGLRDVLSGEEDIEVCGDANSAAAALDAIGRLNPDLLILDLFLGADDDIELVRRVHERWPSLLILVLSMQDETLFAERIIAMGARGYVMKKEASSLILAASRKVLAGEYYVSPDFGNRLFSRKVGNRRSSAVGRDLTPREREVLADIAAGKSTQEISQHLGINIKTVDTHRRSMREKLGLATANELVRYAIQWNQGVAPRPPSTLPGP